ncbi:6-carboxytetrahydropterin synthase QueD [Desulfobotulus sp. H1]|uniref:6-carboxy-5,6,7,8-tetrahydropterin synthase n=1 Tax=Desulfobotulus pelophilus TaxID=2823377 RepID=A0ABT3N999_9BACT|nr:6-carboxytetrahydropterin synthase QueD [Desulfobotulus pelophilus]MCW7754038.1 6-carboxytetrahydropterin synthase QueD [Desulfobotulus pelophilus]
MYELRVRGDFAAAHQLHNVTEKCENLHGHNFEVEAAVEGNELGEAHVLMDFGLLKQYVREILASLDHCFLNEHPAFAGKNASSENIARFIADKLAERLLPLGEGVRVRRVRVWESARASAAYYP